MPLQHPNHMVDIPPRVLQQIPAMPEIATRVFQMVEKKETDVMDLARVISMDPMLTAKILKTANSPYYAPAQAIVNVTQAVTRVGFRALRNLVLVECLPFRNRQGPADPVALGVWEHLVATGIGSRILAPRMGGVLAEDAFVAGLLHDIGKSVLAVAKGKDYAELVAEAQQGDRTFAELEQARYGFTHADAGASVLKMWQLPEAVIEGVRWHHDVQSGPSPKMWAGVVVASRASHALGLGLENRPGLEIAACPEAELLKLGPVETAALTEQLAQAYEAEKSQFLV